MTRIKTALLFTILAVAAPRESFALISGGEGNQPLRDPGWPTGAAAIFNHPGRIAYWEGPPFGGGEWHAECRGDVKALNAVLGDFAKLEVKTKRLVVHDGAGYSFWLAPNNEPEKRNAARVDWVFVVWQAGSWERLHKMPVDFNPTDPADTDPPAQVDVYTGQIRWEDVTVPKGIEVNDQRLVAHGFNEADGVVIEGKATDLATKMPVAATVRLERVEPQKKGGYLYPAVAETKADDQGRWVLKKAPAGWLRVVVGADGYVSRVAGYARFAGPPKWQTFDCGLARSGPVSGRVIGEDGKPLADVDVRFAQVQAGSGRRYESPTGFAFKTDADGRFRADQVPAGKATVWAHKVGYFGPGRGTPITTPKDDVELTLRVAAGVRVTVDFTDKQRPGGYIVKITPEGGDVIGSYGGSGNIDDKNQIAFKDLPPGRYFLTGRPNPGSDAQETGPVAVDLKAGQTPEVTLKAK